MANNQNVNKVVYGNQTLIDLTNDTAEANQVLEGYYFHTKNGERVRGQIGVNSPGDVFLNPGDSVSFVRGYYTPFDVYVSDYSFSGDALPSEVVSGKYFYSDSDTLQEGTMTNNGAVSGSIDGLNTMSYTVPAGYHNGSGTVTLTNDIENLLDTI